MPRAPIALIILGALTFNFMTGFHDAANAIATSVLTRALSIPTAVVLAAVLNLAGAMVNESVATTIGKGMVAGSFITEQIVLAALVGTVIWLFITWRLGLPTSCSHTIIGAIIGAASAASAQVSVGGGMLGWSYNYGIFNFAGLKKIFLALLLSPVFGLVIGFAVMVILLHIFAHSTPSILNRYFRRLQVLSASLMAFSHGSNDAQNAMGIITMALVAGGYLGTFVIPIWVKIVCALALALGTGAGGWRIIKTLGRKVMTLKPIHGFAAETCAAGVIQVCTHIGAPISTTHVISSAIMGVGISRRLTGVRWKVAGQIIMAWVLTLPITAVLAAFSYWLLAFFF